MKNSVLNFLFFLISVNCFAQSSLPFYEQNQTGEYYLLRNDSVHDFSQFKSLTILTKNGITKTGSFQNLHSVTEKECCTSHDPEFLMGELKLSAKTDSVFYIIGGTVTDGKLFSSPLSSVTDFEKFVSPGFQKTLLGINYDSEYSYRWTLQTNNKYYLEEKDDANYFGTSPDNIVYPVDLKNCIYSKNDSIEILYCTADSVNENFQFEPRWSIIYINGKLIDARADYSLLPADGYGPFFYKLKFPAGWYRAENDFYILFSAGFVLHEHNGAWSEESRAPCLYYGECDCGE